VALELALGTHDYLADIAVTTVQGRRVFVSLAQAVTLLSGQPVSMDVPRLSRTLPIRDRLPTDLAIGADQVIYALGVNQVLPVAARLRWRWSDGHEERPVAAMTTEEAVAQGFQLRARASLPRLQAVDPAWLLANCGVCVGVRRGCSVSWCAFLPLAALAQVLTGRASDLPGAYRDQPTPFAIAAD
jgi:hypothetical protein